MNFVPSLEYSKEFITTVKYFLKSEQQLVIDDFIEIIAKYRNLLIYLPFVKEVAICNNLSFGIVTKNSDIDLFIVLKKNRFFIGQFFILLILHILDLRVYKSKLSKRFCLSFFVADDLESLKISKYAITNDIYLKHWFTSLIFLKNDFNFQNVFLDLNRDLLLFNNSGFRNFSLEMTFKYSKIFKILEKILNYKLFDFLEFLLRKIQLIHYKMYYKNVIKFSMDSSSIVIKNGTLKFHLNDIRKKFRDYYLSLSK